MRNTVAKACDACNEITVTGKPDGVTVNIGGAAFDNLKELAGIYSDWAGRDITPADLFMLYLSADEAVTHLQYKDGGGAAVTLAGEIVEAFFDQPVLAGELEERFNAAGFAVTR